MSRVDATPTMRRRVIGVGDTVASVSSGRLYRVDEIMTPASGRHFLHGRSYGVTDLATGLANGFTGDEIVKLTQREIDERL